MLVTLGHTANFVIQYENQLKDGKRRAKALKSTCEADFAQLRSWFTATGGFGPKNRVTISIISTGLGANGQYQTGGGMWIQINGFDGKPNKDLADDAVRAVFVAEAVELLMSYQNIKTKKTTWHPGWSDGEGLSRVSMELLYFEAAYQLIGAPFVNTWMQSSKRPDFISKNQTTDENATSFGCAMLFIYYLYSQLGFSLPGIINKAGGTLEETYHALTGKKGGYQAFTKLLGKFFPIGDTPLLPFDNPFPLLDGAARNVYVTATESQASPPEGSTSGTATFNACGSGPTTSYKWTLTNQNEQLTCVAHVTGFGQPVYNWKINGSWVPSPDSGFISVNATVLVDDPNNPEHPASSTQSVTLYFESASSQDYHGNSATLVIWNETYQGHILLIIEADVSELYASKDVTSGLILATLDSQKLTYEKQYYKDLAGCRLGALDQFGPIQEIAPWVTLLLTLPDPAPEVTIGAVVLSAVSPEIAAISATRPEIGQQVAMTVSRILNVPVAMLLTSTTQAGG